MKKIIIIAVILIVIGVAAYIYFNNKKKKASGSRLANSQPSNVDELGNELQVDAKTGNPIPNRSEALKIA
jgi:uncharacterized protein YpmB